MMKIESIRVVNFGSFAGSQKFELAGHGLTLVLGKNLDEPRMNSNGAGKSTLFDALDWVLYGEVPRGDNVDSVVNDNATACEVDARLVDDQGQQLMVQRVRTRGRKTELHVQRGNDLLDALDLSETQKILDELLGMDREVFHAAVYFSQDAMWNFMDATDAQRIEILTRILGLSDLEVYRERVAAKLVDLRQQQVQLDGQTRQMDGELMALRGIDWVPQIQQWEGRHAEALGTLRMRLEMAQHAQQQVPAHDAQVVQQLAGEIEWEKRRVYPSPAMEFAARKQEAQLAYDRWAIARVDAGRRAQKIERQMEQMRQQAGGVCSACGQQITGEHVQRELVAMQVELEKERAAEADAARALPQWEATLAQIRVEVVAAEAQESQRVLARSQWLHQKMEQLERARAGEREWQQTQQVVQLAQADLAREQQAVNPFVQKQQEHLGRVAELTQRRSGYDVSVQQAARNVAHWEFWNKAFGPKGLVSYILDYRLNELTDAANRWVQLLTGGTFWMRFETQTQGRTTGRLANQINPRLFRWNPDGTISERNYRSWSGGEKRRIAWAVDFGLSRLVAARAKHAYDLLILDEVFKHVDAAGGEAVVEMLRGLKAERGSIFVIEHDSTFQSHFDHQLTVVRQGGRSQILVEGRVDEAQVGHQVSPAVESPAQPAGAAGSPGLQAGVAVPRRRRRRAAD